MSQNPKEIRVIDPVLTNFAQGYRHTEHVGMTLFPQVPVQIAGGQVLEFGKESFKLYQARRAPGTATKRVQFGYLGRPFALVQDSLEGQVPSEYLRDAAAVPEENLGQRATIGAMRALSMTLEYEQAKLATTAGNYDSNHKTALTGITKWSDAASNPTDTIETGKEAIRQSVGIYPNLLVLSAQAFKVLKFHPDVVDRIKYTSRSSITPDMLANIWDLDKVVVGKAVAFNDNGTAIDIWGNNAILAYVPTASMGMEEPSYGYTYTMAGHPLVEKPYYENNTKSWIYPVTYERIPVQTGLLSGYLIQNPA